MINTERLILRKWQDRDLKPFAQINSDKLVCEFLPKTLNRDESNALVEKIRSHFDKHDYGLYAIELRYTGQFIGFTGLNNPTFPAHFMPAVEIGWRIGSEYWGHGYATEAANAVLNYAFQALKIPEIVSFTVPENERSRNVMKKIGLQHNKQDDFDHPNLPKGHPLQRHVLYRLKKK